MINGRRSGRKLNARSRFVPCSGSAQATSRSPRHALDPRRRRSRRHARRAAHGRGRSRNSRCGCRHRVHTRHRLDRLADTAEAARVNRDSGSGGRVSAACSLLSCPRIVDFTLRNTTIMGFVWVLAGLVVASDRVVRVRDASFRPPRSSRLSASSGPHDPPGRPLRPIRWRPSSEDRDSARCLHTEEPRRVGQPPRGRQPRRAPVLARDTTAVNRSSATACWAPIEPVERVSENRGCRVRWSLGDATLRDRSRRASSTEAHDRSMC